MHEWMKWMNALIHKTNCLGFDTIEDLSIFASDSSAPCCCEWRQPARINEAMPLFKWCCDLLNWSSVSQCFERDSVLLLHFCNVCTEDEVPQARNHRENYGEFFATNQHPVFVNGGSWPVQVKLCRCLIEAAALDVLGAAAALHYFLLHFEISALKTKCLRL